MLTAMRFTIDQSVNVCCFCEEIFEIDGSTTVDVDAEMIESGEVCGGVVVDDEDANEDTDGGLDSRRWISGDVPGE